MLTFHVPRPTAETMIPRSKRILVVEDHKLTQRTLEQYLGKQYVVEFARTGEEALHLASVGAYAVILLDINLIGPLSGLDVLNRLKASPRYDGVKMIAVTGYSKPGYREYLLAQGFDGYVAKPYTWKHLSAVLQKAIETATPTAAPITRTERARRYEQARQTDHLPCWQPIEKF